MDKLKVLMVDDNISLINMVKEYFKSSNDVEVVLEAYDGEQGIKMIESNQDKYDLIVLDLIMPKKDGMYVLEEMKKRNINKKVIVATSYNASDVIREVSEYGVSYFILKPFELVDLEKRIVEAGRKNDKQTSITKILHELGIPSHIKGYQYIREGIGIIYEHPETIGGITKELYPELAEKFDTTVSSVLLSAINSTFNFLFITALRISAVSGINHIK